MTSVAADVRPRNGWSRAGRTGRWAAVAARVAFTALVVIMPFRLRIDPLPHPSTAVPAVLADVVVYAIDGLILATIGLWLVGRMLDRRPIELGPSAVRLPAALLVALAWLTIPFGVAPWLSVAGAARLTGGAVLALYVLNEVERFEDLALPVGLMLALQSVVAVGQVVIGGAVGLGAIGEQPLDPDVIGTSVVSLADGTRLLRAYGLSTHPNVLGGFLACGLLLVMGAGTRTRVARWGQAVVVFLAAAALVGTFSRGAWLGAGSGFVAGLALLAIRRPRSALPPDRPGPAARRWLATAALAVVVAGGAAWLARDAIASRTWLGPSVPATEQRSIDERLDQIRLGWRVLQARPLSGAGASAVPIAMHDLEPDFPYDVYAPHLVPLTVAGELGIGGGLAYLLLMIGPWALLAAARRRWTPDLATASAALAALTVVSLFDDYPWVGGPGRTLGWFVIGAWMLAWRRATPRPPAGSGA